MSKTSKQISGARAEALACERLKSLGHKIHDTNVRLGYVELDIVSTHDDVLCFSEVKYRKNHSFGGPLAALTLTKQERLIKAASKYLLRKFKAPHLYPRCRFDVISVSGDLESATIEYFPNAFEARR